MTQNREVVLGDHKLKFIDGKPAIGRRAHDAPFHALTLEELTDIAEFTAEAWLALTDEDCQPVAITENGYVYDEGMITLGPKSVVAIADAVSIALDVPREVTLEDDQE